MQSFISANNPWLMLEIMARISKHHHWTTILFRWKTVFCTSSFQPLCPEFTDVDAFIEFVRKVALLCDFDSGYCGYAFKHLHMTFRREAFKAIGRMALRYIGFDIANNFIRDDARGRDL